VAVSQGSLRIAKLSLVCVLAALGVALLGGAASAAGTGNHVAYGDPAGDAQSSSSTNYASDIRQVDVTSTDVGKLTFQVTMSDADAKLVNGDELSVFVDIDRKASTGDANGFEYEFLATGSNNGTSFLFCTLVQPRSCEEIQSGNASDQPTSSTTHVITFVISTSVAAFAFLVQEAYTQPGQTASLYDFAPNSGRFTFETKTDPDGDGLFGSGDSCPTVRARGIYDKNNNGCPGPFAFISTKEAHFKGLAFPAFMRLSQVRVTGTPPGSKVLFSSPRGGDSAKANSSGVATSHRVKGDFRYGSVISIQITKPGLVGVLLSEVVSKSGLQVVSRRCIPATGGRPVACSGKLKGS
jgi:hypothetical protein